MTPDIYTNGYANAIQSVVGPEMMTAAGRIVDHHRSESMHGGGDEIVCLQQAKIAIFEDDPDIISTMMDFFNYYSEHNVVATATNLTEALNLIPALESLGVQVATVDGNLGRFSRGGSDGRRIIAEIRRQHPGITTIGMSADRLPESHIDSRKGSGMQNLLNIIANL